MSRVGATSDEVQGHTPHGGGGEEAAAAIPLTSVPSKPSTLLLNGSRGHSEKARR